MKRVKRGALAMLTMGVAWGTTDPAVYRPVASPSVIRAGEATSVRVAVLIAPGKAQRVTAATLWRSNGSGTLLAQVGEMNDMGMSGDIEANDRHYSVQVMMEESRTGLQYFRVAASVEGVKDPVLSIVIAVETLPREAPLQAAAPAFERTVADPGSDGRLACDGIVLLYAKGSDFLRIQDTARRINGRVIGVQAFSGFNAWNIGIPCTDYSGLLSASRTASADAAVLATEFEGQGELAGLPINDPLTAASAFPPNGPGNWYKEVGLDKAWMITTGSKTFTPKIAIVDTGVNYAHEDLKTKVIKGKDFKGINDNDPMDEQTHGTAVAGLAGAITNNGIGVAGAAPDNKLIAIRIGNENPSITHMVAGIENAVELAADVINMSWGGPIRSERLAAAIDDAYTAGKLCVASAGNNNRNKKFYPAGFNDTETFQGLFSTKTYHPHLISVGGTGPLGSRGVWTGSNGEQLGSNYGDWVDISAPAVSFITTSLAVPETGGQIYTDRLQGTSGSAPMVSGAAALVWSADWRYSPDEVRALLLETANPTGSSDPEGRAIRELSAFAAVVRAASRTCDNCLAGSVQSIAPALYPSTGVQIHLGSNGGAPGVNMQNASVHGFAFSVKFRPFIRALFSTNLKSCDAYVNGAFYDLFSMSMSSVPYWELALQDDARPQLNSFFTAGGFTRRFNSGCVDVGQPVVSQDVTRPSGQDQWFNIVLDTRTLPFADNFLVSWGTVTLEDLSPQ